ncbi:uncharacterized protein M437DRAFT_66821 [Aureobasidium melanogenum CBS 110374]|uniref:Uncharacterized protein n=1 Tax=Aureobasidium melanogenum (strain CBS 110374) TaxID=1043003 RepID=A0A074WHC6_AURM1|nr:uncharacterized protein M437DRAFT_66821 [Aureobasidium melanogenum CBS 110374]KEQ61866.1 hypothetical protein M437DRAFT_66821 [Aureobasidium melanogenum CBS 110374]
MSKYKTRKKGKGTLCVRGRLGKSRQIICPTAIHLRNPRTCDDGRYTHREQPSGVAYASHIHWLLHLDILREAARKQQQQQVAKVIPPVPVFAACIFRGVFEYRALLKSWFCVNVI